MRDFKIIVATHKKYDILEKEYFLPVHAGAAVSDQILPYQRDDEGENISDRNRYYCELTALYWAYRNLKHEYIGLCHYRRYFKLDLQDIGRYDVIVPRKRHYYIETVYDQFSHAHGRKGLDEARKVIKERYPDYLETFDQRMKKRSLHIYNMFIMRYDIFVSYCDFLFDILFEVEKRIGDQDRLYGYISERLLDVYLDRNRISYKEVKIVNVEPENWPKKIYEFLMRKVNKRG